MKKRTMLSSLVFFFFTSNKNSNAIFAFLEHDIYILVIVSPNISEVLHINFVRSRNVYERVQMIHKNIEGFCYLCENVL